MTLTPAEGIALAGWQCLGGNDHMRQARIARLQQQRPGLAVAALVENAHHCIAPPRRLQDTYHLQTARTCPSAHAATAAMAEHCKLGSWN